MKLKNKKILVTCGPTWIPIDDIRIISNKSTGKLGHQIANDLLKYKSKVTLVEGPINNKIKSKEIKVIKFSYFDELLFLLKRELKKNFDIIIHAAAVSDYKLLKPFKNKLSSKAKTLNLKLVQTEKIIKLIKKLNPNIFLVGFKQEPSLTKNSAKLKCRSLFKDSHCDLVIANFIKNQKYYGYILDKNYNILSTAESRKDMSKNLTRILKGIK